MAILKIKNETGKFIDIPAIKGDKGDPGETGVFIGKKEDALETHKLVIEETENHKSVSGTEINITDGIDSSVKRLRQYGITKQDGIPTPDASVEIEVGKGKNLFDKDNLKYVNAYNDTSTNKLTSTDTAKMLYIPIKGGETYTIQKILSSRFVICTTIEEPAIGVSTSNHTQNYSATKITITTNDTANYLVVMYYVITSDTLTEQEILNSIQIEKGSVATSYSPYKSISVKSTGKNLCKMTDFIYDTTNLQISVNDGFINVNSTSSNCHIDLNGGMRTGPWQPKYDEVKDYKLTPANQKQYVAKLFIDELLVTGKDANFFSIHTNQRNIVTTFTGSDTIIESKFTLSEDEYVKQISLWINGTNTSVILKGTVQLEQSIEATEYEPYKESSIHYKLGDNFLADKDYIQDGVLNKNIGKVVLNGSESDWSLTTGTNRYSFWRRNININNCLTARHKKYCDYFNYSSLGYPDAPIPSLCENNVDANANTFMFIFNTDGSQGTTVDEWKAWLSENPITLYYELATPEQIQLETTGELRTFEPNTIITNDLDTNMEVDYNTTPNVSMYYRNKNGSFNKMYM